MHLLASRNVLRLCLLAIVLFIATNTYAVFYWDTNGSASGTGGAPSGSWDTVTPNWWDSHGAVDDGLGDTTAYVQGVHVHFSHGSDAVGNYTITVASGLSVSDMHCDDGNLTLTGSPLFWSGSGDRLISVMPGQVFTINCGLTNDIGASDPATFNAFHKYKLGTLILGGNCTYTGSTMIEGGILKLGASERIPNTSKLILFNGDGRPDDGFIDTPATFATGGFSETLGPLQLAGPNAAIARTIDFGNGNSTLSFANSSAEDWNGIPLTIVNYTPGADKLRFGTDNTGLTAVQLASIRFNDANAPGKIDNAGFVTPDLPVFKSAHILGNQIQLSWSAVDGRNYRLEYRDTLSVGWNPLTDLAASGDTITTTDGLTPTTRFYRVELLP